MSEHLSKPCTAFEGQRRLLSGPLIEVALAVKSIHERKGPVPLLVFDDATGRVIDFDLRGSKTDIIARLSHSPPINARPSEPCVPPPLPTSQDAVIEPRGRGRPKLGVIAREVTLLPRHWEWLAAQPGGASVVLRKLVEEARRSGDGPQKARAAQQSAYNFMHAMAGDLPGFEEAIRALFADDRSKFEQHMSGWPKDIRLYAVRLAFPRAAGS